jgi:hypothetical protein
MELFVGILFSIWDLGTKECLEDFSYRNLPFNTHFGRFFLQPLGKFPFEKSKAVSHYCYRIISGMHYLLFSSYQSYKAEFIHFGLWVSCSSRRKAKKK